MIDAIILNRNLGEVCDALYQNVEELLGPTCRIEVVDSSTSTELASKRVTVLAKTDEALEHGLRFGRGMNMGLNKLLESGPLNPWILLLPVDTEVVKLDLESLVDDLATIPELVAVKPLPDGSPYAKLLGERGRGIGWNFEEGPWLLNSDFVRKQIDLNSRSEFFDSANFRGFLTGLELSFKAYANGNCVGLTRHLVLRENESHLIEKADLIKTEPLDENLRMLVEEGEAWLGTKYGIQDSWDFAQVVRLLFDRFLIENPDLQSLALVGGIE